MSALIQTAIAYRLAILIAVLFSLNALATSFAAAFTGVDWKGLSGTQHCVVIALITANWTGALLAFFNKTLSRVEQGQFPIETGSADIIVKTTTTTETKP